MTNSDDEYDEQGWSKDGINKEMEIEFLEYCF